MIIVPSEPWHAKLIRNPSEDPMVLGFGESLHELVAEMITNCPAFSLLSDDHQLIAMGGIQPVWKGVGELFIYGDKALMHDKCFKVVRSVLRGFNLLHAHLMFHRLQACVRKDNGSSIRLANMLGLSHESDMPKYGPNGEDYIRLARISWPPQQQ